MTDDFLQARINRGKRAEALVRDEMLIEAFDEMVSSYYADWLKTSPGDSAERERIYLKARQVGELRERLVRWATDGNLAQAELDQNQ